MAGLKDTRRVALQHGEKRPKRFTPESRTALGMELRGMTLPELREKAGMTGKTGSARKKKFGG